MTDEQLQTELETAVRNLRDRIAAAPPNSHSARSAAVFLDFLDRNPDRYPTVAAKLAGVREAARELTLDLRSGTDIIRHDFNLGPDTNPRPPRRQK